MELIRSLHHTIGELTTQTDTLEPCTRLDQLQDHWMELEWNVSDVERMEDMGREN